MYNYILEENNENSENNVKDVNKITVAFPLFGEPSSFINKQGEKDGLLWKMWTIVWDNMKKEKSKYSNVTPIIKVIQNPDIDTLIKGVHNKEYDIVIGDFSANPERLKYTNFSSSFMSVKDVGVYLADYSNESLEYAIFRKIMNILYYPLLVLIMDANSSFCVLAKLNPSIIRSLIRRLSMFLV